MNFTVYRKGETKMTAKTRDAEEALMVASLHQGSRIKFGYRVVWVEGSEGVNAFHSLQRSAEIVRYRISRNRRNAV